MKKIVQSARIKFPLFAVIVEGNKVEIREADGDPCIRITHERYGSIDMDESYMLEDANRLIAKITSAYGVNACRCGKVSAPGIAYCPECQP